MQIIIFLLLIVSSLYSENTLIIEKEQHLFDDFKVQRYEDKTAAMDLNDIRQMSDLTTVPNNITEGYSRSAFWYKFEIVNHLNIDVKYIIDITEKHIYEVDLYIVAGEKTTHYKGGNSVSYEERIIQSPTTRFPVYLNSKEKKTLYIRMKCGTTIYTSIKVADENSLVKADLLKNQLLGLYFGTILIFVFYSIFLYFSIREKIFLYYIAYVSSFAMWQITLAGFPPFATLHGDIVYQIVSYSLVFLAIFLILFSRELLLTKRLVPKLDKILSSSIWLIVLTVVISQSDSTFMILVINALSFFLLPFLLVVAIISYRSGNKSARYYLQGQVVFLVMMIPVSLMSANFFPYNNFSRYGSMLGSMYEIAFFSLALASRITILKDEKLKVEIKAKKELEIKVETRTKDLKRTQDELKELNQTLEARVEWEVEQNRKQQELMIQKNRLIQMGEMINNIAHQWRQPLGRINSNIAVVGSILKPNVSEYKILKSKINNIKKNTKYMSDTIEDFSNFFHPDKKESLFLLQNIIKGALELIESRTKGVEINIMSDSDVRVLSFKKEYQQVVLIILNNAIDNFESKSIQAPKIDIMIKEYDNMAYLSICDNGSGIEKKEINRIFEPYYTTKFANEGTGLGLYMAKMLVESSMGGQLQVKNKKDGVCFKIEIPKGVELE